MDKATTGTRRRSDAPPGPGGDALDERIATRTARVVVVGQGYVGLPLAMRASEVGFPVTGLESAPDRLHALRAGSSYVEDVSSERLGRALQNGYAATGDAREVAGFDVAIISVPTPLRDGAPDLSAVEEAGRAVATQLGPGALVILESTTYPGTTERLLQPILEEGSGLRAGSEFFLGYSPERLDPANPRWPFERIPKVVSGIDETSCGLVARFYGALIDQVVPVQSTAEAELVKLLENTFRHVNVALVNELAMFANELGIDIWNVIDAAATKPFGFMRFTPGPGVGGHCLPIDPSYLSWHVRQQVGQTFRFVELATDLNRQMPEYVVQRIAGLLNGQGKAIKGSRILQIGLAYKAASSDCRESPAMVVAERLEQLGADLRCCDSYVGHELPIAAPVVELTDRALEEADLVALLVDHPDLPLDRIARHARLVFDAKGLLREHEFVGEML